ncbi:MAG: response regulator [Candidatus Omnitrophica bacterium]|nr:response regulator [Candidatus Omnitrophota bacterium]
MLRKIKATRRKDKTRLLAPPKKLFPIIGIGGSAGGLEAFQELLKNISNNPGMAIVFIMHLAPGHKSMLRELLARLTKMSVSEITNGMPLEVNHVYVIPPGVDVSIAGGKLVLSNMKNAGLKRMPIDYFFRSLAEAQGNRAIGVILSGTATDGTLGAEAIKAEGGITFAQDEQSAKYAGMPQSAVAAGCVDFVLSPKKIARELERIARHPFISPAGAVKTDKPIITEDKGLESIFDILRSGHGLDFTHYKASTIMRRVSRRMVLLKLEKLQHYAKFLIGNKDEAERLYEDLLINVTSFFRDGKVFHTLKKLVLSGILKNKTKGQEVRIWVPGCSSGEEAYSIAICLIELMENKKSEVPIKIFATDASESGIHKAHRGLYGENIKNDVTPECLKRFFTKEGHSYKISKRLREMCIISKHNVFSDPPFSNLDLISCRNLLIYLQPVLQRSVFYKFHYGLRPGGFLFLGNSESVSGYSNLFKALDRKQRIFVKKYLPIEPELESGQKYSPPKKLEIKEKAGIKKGKEMDIESMIERLVQSVYASCGVLIDSDMEVVLFRGHTGRFLESEAGKPSLNIFKLVREGLCMPLRAAIYKARGTKHTVKREAQDVSYNGRKVRVNITVVPAKYGPLKEEFFLVLFDEIGRAAGLKNLPKGRGRSLSLKGKSAQSGESIDILQKELAETKEYLQTIIEEHENALEEVKTTNEEILSSNEELQSINEELETAKEELQSSNEELITSNEELQNRNAETFLLSNDLINLLGSINIPVIMMGTDLAIRRVTSQAEKVLNVIPSDIGRPISKIKLNVDIPDLEKTLTDVMESLHPKTFELKDRGENWYSVYIRPYRTLDNKIDGVVAVFIDITERKKIARELAQAKEQQYKTLIDNLPQKVFLKDRNSVYISCNKNYARDLKIKPKEIAGKTDRDFFPTPLAEKYRADDKMVMESGKTKNIEEDYIVIGKFPGGSRKAIVNTVKAPVWDKAGNVTGLVGIFWDITEHKQAEEALRANEMLKKLNQIKSDFVSTVSHELRTPLTTMKEFTSIILDEIPGKLTKQQKEYMDIIGGNIDRLARLINNLLDISKIESGRLELKKALVDMANLANGVISILKPEAQAKHIEFKTLFPAAALNVYADSDKMVQVFTNLIGNAIKFSKENGEITVEIKDAAEEVVCSIADTGIGVAPENLDKLFDKFRQINRAVGAGAKGTGLGLAISKELIEMHNGRIWAESELSKGSKFIFTLPKHSKKSILFETVEKNITGAQKENKKFSIFVIQLDDYSEFEEGLGKNRAQKVFFPILASFEEAASSEGFQTIRSESEVVVFAQVNRQEACGISARLKRMIKEHIFEINAQLKKGFSYGCAIYPDDADNAKDLLERAYKSCVQEREARSRKNIMIVDDEPELRNVLRKILQANGYSNFTEAGDGKEALEKIKTAVPDLLILDLKMPLMGGYEVIGMLKEDAQTKDMPILIMSGDAAEIEKLGEYVKAKAIPLVGKPFNTEQLKKLVNYLL